MQAKIHLLIITAIILVIFLIWLVLFGDVEKKQPIVVSPYVVHISRATYGEACKNMAYLSTNVPYTAEKKSDFKPNNVLETVGKLCNGQVTCNIPVNDKTLEFSSEISCSNKILDVEYRCFTVDRLRKESQYENKELVIDCSNI